MPDKTSLGISEPLRQYIEALVEEVVLEGKPFDEQKEWLRRYSEAEGVDFVTLERNLNDLFEMLEEWKKLKAKGSERSARLIAKNCYVSDGKMDEIISVMVKPLPLRIEDGAVFCTDKSIKGTLEIPSMIDGHLVTSIGSEAFEYCSDLTLVIIPNSVTKIGDNAFRCCKALASIIIPDSVTTIGRSAFDNCSGLTNIVIPNSVTKIGNSAFHACQKLASVVIPDSVTEIGENAFFSSGLRSVVIPDSVTTISPYAFQDCKELISVTIPDSVTWIRHYAFYKTGLKAITIPESVTEIDHTAFEECPELVSINVDIRNKCYDSRDNCNAIIETSTNTLFLGCSSTIIPNTVSKIGKSAFKKCKKLTSIVIPDSVTEIEEYAFNDSGLTSIVIPESIISIGYQGAFYNCSELVSINVDKRNKHYDSRDNCNAIIETSSNMLVQGCCSTKIPNTVTKIGYSAFLGCQKLISVVIPDSVTEIENYAFNGSGLTFVVIPASVTKIDYFAFGHCRNLTSVVIPSSVTEIGTWAFYHCLKLTSLVIPDSVCRIGSAPFEGCSNLVSINVDKRNKYYDSRNDCNAVIETSTGTLIQGCCSTCIPKSVTKIGDGAFAWLKELTAIIIPDSVTEIRSEAFRACEKLTSVIIPNSVTEIGQGAFSVSGLTSVVIPNSVRNIGPDAFHACPLKEVTIGRQNYQKFKHLFSTYAKINYID